MKNLRNPDLTLKEAQDILQKRRIVLLEELIEDVRAMLKGDFRQMDVRVKYIESLDNSLSTLVAIDWMASNPKESFRR